jgi:acyl-CoA reductase-like NAD-dependent aldehyde dehydrogenase
MSEADSAIAAGSPEPTALQRFTRLNPVDGSHASDAVAMTVEEAGQVVDRAAAAFPEWARSGPDARRTLLFAAADAVTARTAELVAAMSAETGAAPSWCGFNAMLAARMLREAGALTTQIGGEVIPSDKPGLLAMATKQAAGVSLGIAPWNAPIILAARAIAVPLACGNAVVLKASELCPATHRLLIEIISGAGFPDGLIGTVTNAPQDAARVVESLIRHPAVRRVNFTGSTEVGRIIGRIAGEELKPALLELGGKAPLLVLADADLDAAVNAAIFGGFMHQGQICMSTERLIVVDAVADAFVEKLAARAQALRVGDPRTAEVQLGSMIDVKAVDRVMTLVTEAAADGAQIVAGGTATGSFMQATVLDQVSPSMRIYHEESFGPTVALIRARDAQDAVRIANDSPFGLSAAIFTRDIALGLKLARQVESGICHINGPTVQDEAQMPFGGVKASGVGRFGGRWGIEFFTDTRWVTIETEEPHYPF